MDGASPISKMTRRIVQIAVSIGLGVAGACLFGFTLQAMGKQHTAVAIVACMAFLVFTGIGTLASTSVTNRTATTSLVLATGVAGYGFFAAVINAMGGPQVVVVIAGCFAFTFSAVIGLIAYADKNWLNARLALARNR